MAVKLFQKKAPFGGRAPWRRRVSLRWALVLTTVLCALGAFLLIALESWGLEWARDALYLKYITPYYADEMETGEYYSVSPDGTLLYVEATMPYAYVDPDTGEIYPIETTSPTLFIPAGPLRFFYKNVGQIAVCAFVLTAALAFLIDAWWFYRWKIKKPLAVLNNASQKIAQNDLDFHVESPSSDEMGQLCQSFETMRASLEANSRALWDAVEERKRLNAAFSHDLRTPLTVLQGYSDFLLDTLPSGDLSPEKTVDTVLTMKRSLVRLQRYVESMNSLQRLEDLHPHRTEAGFSNLCGQLAETGAILRGEGRFQFSAQGEGPLFLDSELLFQVFENLLSNAGRYAQQMVWARAELSEGSLSLTVSDDGPGFPPEALKRAAEPYYRGEKNAPEEENHFGLGLYLCRVLCEKHGGRLEIANRPQGGAQVTARFNVGPPKKEP